VFGTERGCEWDCKKHVPSKKAARKRHKMNNPQCQFRQGAGLQGRTLHQLHDVLLAIPKSAKVDALAVAQAGAHGKRCSHLRSPSLCVHRACAARHIPGYSYLATLLNSQVSTDVKFAISLGTGLERWSPISRSAIGEVPYKAPAVRKTIIWHSRPSILHSDSSP
jgi:hypothetical protein